MTVVPAFQTKSSETTARTDIRSSLTRSAAVELAWRPWRLISHGRIGDGLKVLDDAGTWWEMTSRTEQPMMDIKAILAEILDIVPMTFELVGSVVEGNRVALMVDSYGHLDRDTTYHNAYSFVSDLDPDRDAIVAIREYVDTLHAANVLIPAVLQAIDERGGESALAKLIKRHQQ